MGTIASTTGSGKEFPQLEAGTHGARCYAVIDIGTQVHEYQGDEQRKHQVIIMFEIPDELLDDGRPYAVSAFRTLSLHEKAKLRRELEAWRGRAFTEEELAGFDVANVLGHACMITVVHNANGKAKIEGIGKLVKGMTVKEAVNTLVHFDLDKYLAGDMDEAAKFNALPEWIQNKIRDCEEWGTTMIPNPPEKEDDASDTIEEDELLF